MDKREYFNLGYISKSIGTKGELLFVLDVDNPSRYKKLESVFIELNNTLVPFFINEIKLKGNIATVLIEGIDNTEKAKELVGATLYLPLNFLPSLTGKQFYFHEVIGYEVIDKKFGAIGFIESILNFPQQNIFQIKKNQVEILIPIKNEFIISVDRNNKKIEIQAPEGLIELYLNPSDNEES